MSRFSLKYILLLLAFSITSLVKAQLPKQIIEAGDKFYSNGQFEAAMKVYQEAMDIDSTNAEVLYKYGRSLYKLNEFETATRYLLKSSLLGGRHTFEDLNYKLAETYRRSGKFQPSLRYYSYALRAFRLETDTYPYKRTKQSEISAKWALLQKESEEHHPILNFGSKVNSRASDYAATIKDKKIYFTTIEDGGAVNEEIDEDKDYFNRIFVVDLESEDKKTELIFKKNDSINFQDKHLANLSFGEENEVYFSVCHSVSGCEIWKGNITKNQIVNTIKLNNNINKKNSNNTQPFFVKVDGKKLLYFASNREGGHGGFDLWVSEIRENDFGEAINLGSEINTLGNEITPFYDPKTQLLYFSSDWHEGFGGFDIFSAKGSFKDFTSVENLLQPINSYYNDYYFQTYGDSALFSSNRKEGNIVSDKNCCNDIFKLQFNNPPISLVDIEDNDSTEIIKSLKNIKADVDILNQYLPLSLYFHNDIPNPNSRDSTTTDNYVQLADEYTQMYEEYLEALKDKGQEIKEIEEFFEDNHKAGVASLKHFMPYLHKVLSEGEQITLTIKGFSSTLFESNYNYILALRRIESLINYMKAYKEGILLPYIDNTASNGGSLKFEKLPYGDFAVKDRGFENKTMAVYSSKAANQRKIEVIAVNKDEKIESELAFNSTHYKIGNVKKGNTISRFFTLSNKSENDLKIYNINSNCDCVSLNYPSDIKGKEDGRIELNIDTQNIEGEVNILLIVVTNSQPNLHELKIDLNVKK